MKLTAQEQRMLEGEQGEPKRFAMKILYELGRSASADRMIPIASAHIVACSYSSILDAGIEIYTKLVKQGAKVVVPTTLNPASVDFVRWKEHRIYPEYAENQKKIADLITQMGAIPTWSCTPHYHMNIPRFGQDVAWAESSAVAFINSVIGARTNRMSAYVDLCAALAGCVPRFGLHIKENRKGQILIKISKEVSENFRPEYYAVLGYYLGQISEDRIPVVEGLPGASFDQLKALSAASASSGAIALYHLIGITPEARTKEEAFQESKPLETLVFGKKELEQTLSSMRTYPGSEVDCVAIGCPHASVSELGLYASLLEGKKVAKNTKLFISTSRINEFTARQMGYIGKLEEAGAIMVVDTCINNPPLSVWGFKSLVTDSGKFTYYTPTTVGSKCYFTDTESCIKIAISGRIEKE